MSNHIFEENPPAQAPQQIGGAKAQIEKQARQLLYDSRYQVKKATGGQKIDPANLQRMVIQRINASKSNSAVKSRARQMLNVKEEYVQYMEDSASDLVANALYKVFVEGVNKEESIQLDYLNELAENPDKKYKVSVYDPKSDTRYVRYATREKITQLRSKGLRVELTEYGDPRESEAKKGSQTASALGGGTAKKDYDHDGKIESPAKEHAGAVHNAIQRKRGLPADGKDTSSVKEDFITDATTVDQNTKKITGKGVDNSSLVKVFPEDGIDDRAGKSVNPTNVFAHYESDGDTLSEMVKSKAQKKFLSMVNENKKAINPYAVGTAAAMKLTGDKPPLKKSTIVKAHEIAKKVKMREETECEMDEKPKLKKSEGAVDDVRAIPTKLNLVKNKLRSMGLKMSYEPEGDLVDEAKAVGSARAGDQNPKGAAVRVSSGRGMTMTPARGLGASKPEGDDAARAARQKAQAKADRRAAARDRAAEGEDRVSKLIRSVQKSHYEPEGEQIDESGRRERDQETYGLGGRPGDDRPSRPFNAPTGPKKKPKVKDVNKTAIDMVMAQHGGKKNFL